MRYNVEGVEIRSENTAKPASQASVPVVSILKESGPFQRALDFGCGKLRYASTLQKFSKTLTLVDSTVQIERTQTLRGEVTTVTRYVRRHWRNTRVLDLPSFERDRQVYDFQLCSNVLSAIPSQKSRTEVLKSLKMKLAPEGVLLCITQFRNSYFTEAAKRIGAIPHLDGWILKTSRGSFYYGIIEPDSLADILSESGFAIKRMIRTKESALAFATHC